MQTISHRCEVLPFFTYAQKIESDPARLKTIYENNDLYYLAGQHDPIEGTKASSLIICSMMKATRRRYRYTTMLKNKEIADTMERDANQRKLEQIEANFAVPDMAELKRQVIADLKVNME